VLVGGEYFGYPIGPRNPWMVTSQLVHLFMLGYCVHASVRAWRSGARHKALVVGTGLVLFSATIVAFSLNLYFTFYRSRYSCRSRSCSWSHRYFGS
ncbi:MAG TPA: hypothetical protein VL501_04440, partial [Pyrinomonadaceae bacterium]|nr:hypothetical protein [Pyrinomonadaceae bacterium]